MKPDRPQRRGGAADRQQTPRPVVPLGPVHDAGKGQQDDPSAGTCAGNETRLTGTPLEQDVATHGTGRRRRRPEPTATQRALGLLTRREHSRQELARKLAVRGVDGQEAQAAIDKLAAAGWQDDARFAESLVRSRANSGHGPLRIRAELATHGLDRDAIAAAMDGYDGDFADNACELLRRRQGGRAPDDPAARRKATDLLLRRGFTMEQARLALQRVSEAD